MGVYFNKEGTRGEETKVNEKNDSNKKKYDRAETRNKDVRAKRIQSHLHIYREQSS
jgi:hypothetical protein